MIKPANATLLATSAAVIPAVCRHWRWRMGGIALVGMAATLAGCVAVPANQPYYYQAAPAAAYPVTAYPATTYPATVQGTVVYPGAVYPSPYYAAPDYYYGPGPGVSVGIYGGDGRYRPPPRPDHPGFNRPGVNRPGFNRPGEGQPSRPGARPPGANPNRPNPGAGNGNHAQPSRPQQSQQPIFRTERDGGG